MAKKKKLRSKKNSPDKKKRNQKKSRWSYVEPILRYALLGGGLFYVFHDIHPAELLSHLRQIQWNWVSLAIAIDVVSFITWGLCWKWLMVPVARVSLYDSSRAVYAGQFANELLPARLGELFRAYLVAHWASVEFVSVIPSVIANRLLDGVWSAVGVGLTAVFVRLPTDLLLGGSILGLLVFGGVGSLIYFAYTRHHIMVEWMHYKASGGKTLRFFKWFLGHLATGFQEIGLTRHSIMAFLVSPGWLFLQALAFWIIMLAYGFKLPFWAGAAVFFIVHFAGILPTTPGSIGVYQFFCVLGLTFFGVHKTSATGFSIVGNMKKGVDLW